MLPVARHIPIIAVLAITTPHAFAATPGGPTPDQLKSWVDVRQKRADLLREELKQMDAHIESRVDQLVKTLTAISDSKDSRTKVTRMKEETMKRLARTATDYQQKRAVFRENLRNPQTQLTAEDKQKVIAAFDAKIEKRAQQILAIHKSMPTAKDEERYRVSGNDWSGPTYERNKEFEQNRRMQAHANTQRDALIKELDSSISRLERLGRDLEAQLAATTDPGQRKERQAEVARNRTLITARKEQRRELFEGSTAAQRSVTLKEAVDLDQTIKKAVEELRRDITVFFQRYNEFIQEMTALRATQATLAAAR